MARRNSSESAGVVVKTLGTVSVFTSGGDEWPSITTEGTTMTAEQYHLAQQSADKMSVRLKVVEGDASTDASQRQQEQQQVRTEFDSDDSMKELGDD